MIIDQHIWTSTYQAMADTYLYQIIGRLRPTDPPRAEILPEDPVTPDNWIYNVHIVHLLNIVYREIHKGINSGDGWSGEWDDWECELAEMMANNLAN